MSGVVAWFTGLPSSGKSTLAGQVAAELRLRGVEAVVLDSDDLRGALVPRPGYDEQSRANLYGTLARLAATIARQGHVVLVPATAHRRAFRDAARQLAPSFIEIFVDTPLEECKRRDTKGLYANAVAQAPGVGIDYEPPLHPELRVVSDGDDAAMIANRIEELLG
ncbi:MAG TPA: adenylyl-sulfate kinase [Kofleriaceae bacterium]|nr:adenylyl-sulfate kinase [Kofleriaceae bacterium]